MNYESSESNTSERKHTAPVSLFREKLPYIKLFMAPVLWGGALVAGRVVSAELPPLTTTCIRFFIASLFMVPALRWKEGSFPRPSKADAGWILLLSLTGVVLFNFFLFSGLQTVTAVKSSVMIAFTPSLVAIIAYFLLHEAITLRKGAGILLAFIGAVLTITNGNFKEVIAAGFSSGDLFLVGCVIAWAAYSIIAKFAMSRLSPLAVLTYGSIAGVLMLFPLTLTENGWAELSHVSSSVWWSMAYLSLGAAGIAYLWYYEGIHAVGSSKASVFLNMEPVSAIILGILILNEPFSGVIAAGAVLVISGLYLTTSSSSKKTMSSAA